MYSLSVILVSLVSLATNKGDDLSLNRLYGVLECSIMQIIVAFVLVRVKMLLLISFPSRILLRAFDCPSFNFKQRFSFLYNSSNTFFIAIERYFSISALCVDTLNLLLCKFHYLLWQYNVVNSISTNGNPASF